MIGEKGLTDEGFVEADGDCHCLDCVYYCDDLFDIAVYRRGAMTLHQLRVTVGDPTFFAILKRWTQERKGDNVTTDEFIALAEKMSGTELDDLFDAWLFTPGRPVMAAPLVANGSASDGASAEPLPWPPGLRP